MDKLVVRIVILFTLFNLIGAFGPIENGRIRSLSHVPYTLTFLVFVSRYVCMNWMNDCNMFLACEHESIFDLRFHMRMFEVPKIREDRGQK